MRIQTLHWTIVFGLVVLSGCSLFGSDTEVRPVSVQQVELAAQSGLRVEFVVTAQWRNTCGEFSHFDSSRDNTTYSITMYGQQPEGAICGQAFVPITGAWSTRVPHVGTYTFEFQRQGSAPHDTTIVFMAP
jgi:hypothetical protein